MATVPTTNVNAYFANTTPGQTIISAVIDPAIQDIVTTVNANDAVYQALVTGTELAIPDQTITTRLLRNGAVTAPKIVKAAVVQFTYDFAQIDNLIANVVVGTIPQSVIGAIAASATTQANAYTDAQIVIVLASANTYTNNQIIAANITNKVYTDSQIAIETVPARIFAYKNLAGGM